MSMTRKDFTAIADLCRDLYPEDEGTREQWKRMRDGLAALCHTAGGYDTNGNRRFDRDRFIAATQPKGATG